jgi:RNA polymerase sigma-70 factor (ECF subfamily)
MTVDEKIIQECIAGKRRAQNQLYNAFAPGMLGVCMRYCINRAEAEDVLQEGFVKVFRYIKNFRSDGSFEGWIRRIMVNTAITNYNKRSKVYHEEVTENTLSIEDDSSGEEVYMPVDREILMRLIQQLPDGYRMVLNLYVFEGYKHREISGILDISENTSKSQLSKARKYLKNEMEKLEKVKSLQY